MYERCSKAGGELDLRPAVIVPRDVLILKTVSVLEVVQNPCCSVLLLRLRLVKLLAVYFCDKL